MTSAITLFLLFGIASCGDDSRKDELLSIWASDKRKTKQHILMWALLMKSNNMEVGELSI